MSVAVSVRDLVKDYPQRRGPSLRAVDGISFEVRTGEVFGFLGPNGAGKTTTLEIIEGLLPRSGGAVEVLGIDPGREAQRLKSRIGIQLQASSYFEHLSLVEILELFGSFYTRQRDPLELLNLVGLADKAHAFIKHLSGGQAQRFSLVAALVNDPEIVFLDEATTGLDPRARRDIWDVVQQIRGSGTTVVLTTHYMEEAQFLCDRVAIIDQGRIVAIDKVDALRRLVPPPPKPPEEQLATLEDVFLALTGKQLGENQDEGDEGAA